MTVDTYFHYEDKLMTQLITQNVRLIFGDPCFVGVI
ncbi:MAG: hypothetical protein J07HQW2_00983 [Haloquadratum walsbyi J07HQW2]|uniref:Uncharacterized protein n=1 Tax=Haloquadratum walsbyi J07HQW2 TaxID=1238425 RepID=U1PLH2_9EURY|nr:MAG: hypothetical protein J07HQW2_00983 [Haloquadratum walsbyi J07HQW2]